jgi:hypothetical protein
MKNFFLISAFIFIAFSSIPAFSQHQFDSTEITSSVPELVKFHDVIYLIWHEAYPAKNIDALKSYVPDIKTAMAKINDAKLPGILRDKEGKWKDGLVEFNKAAGDYYKAAESNNEQSMLDAAENLHSNFEMMVRTLKPVLKEIDEYHKVLYVIFHKLYPVKKYTDISNLMDDLISKADAITKAPEEKLIKRIPNKVEDYNKAAKDLYESTIELKEILKSNDDSKIDKAVDNMHSKYQKLESVFD